MTQFIFSLIDYFLGTLKKLGPLAREEENHKTKLPRYDEKVQTCEVRDEAFLHWSLQYLVCIALSPANLISSCVSGCKESQFYSQSFVEL